MLKQNFYVIKLRRNFFPLIFLGFTFCLLVFSKTNLPAVKNGLQLWVNSVIPSLFPFFVATELLMHTNLITCLGNVLNRYMKPIFNVRGEGAFAFIMGIISGYPVGAKIAVNFRKNNICTKAECERLLSFTNNSGPLFIIGTIGVLLFKNTAIGVMLFITHLLACISVGILFRFWKKKEDNNIENSDFFNKKTQNNVVSFSNLGEVLADSITSSISTILLIGGFVVIFSSIISILKTSGILNIFVVILSPFFNMIHIDTSFIEPLISGFLEITNGISTISNIACKKLSVNIIFTAFLLGCGGISVLLQVLSITSKTDLSIKPYVYGKLLQGILASVYSYIFIQVFPFFNFDL